MIRSSSKNQEIYHLAGYIHPRGFVLKRASKTGIQISPAHQVDKGGNCQCLTVNTGSEAAKHCQVRQ